MDPGAAAVEAEGAVAVDGIVVAVSDVVVVVETETVVDFEEIVVEVVGTEAVVVVGIEDVVGNVGLDGHPHTLGRRNPELLASSYILELTWCRDEMTQQAMDLSSYYLDSPYSE